MTLKNCTFSLIHKLSFLKKTSDYIRILFTFRSKSITIRIMETSKTSEFLSVLV